MKRFVKFAKDDLIIDIDLIEAIESHSFKTDRSLIILTTGHKYEVRESVSDIYKYLKQIANGEI